MQEKSTAETRRSLLLSFVFLGLAAALVIVPYQFRSEAGSKSKGQGLVPKTVSHEEGLDNYDIREDKTDASAEALLKFRQASGKDAVAVADIRDSFVQGENALRAKVPTLKVEYNSDIKIPEVISPDVNRGRAFLTGATGGKRSDVLLDFLRENNQLVGATAEQINSLKVFADYTNPDGNLSFVELEQNINGIPVFRGGVKAGFTKSGEMIRVLNNLAPGLDYGAVSANFGSPLDAVKAAAGYINYDTAKLDLKQNQSATTEIKTKFGTGDWATTAEKMYFPTEPGVARAAWRVLIWEPVNAYYVIVDAETGAMLWRKNIADDQTQAATYNVYASTSTMLKALTSPAPLVPASTVPTSNVQGALVPRSNVTLIGNEGVYSFNNNGWITDTASGVNATTDGNALEAGLDIDGTNGVDATGKATAAGRVFSYDYNPLPGNPAPGEAPISAAYRSGAVTQLFYFNNRYHDEMYRLGFTEAARNFQASNFGRGGVEGDRVSGEAQDSSGTNNANFATPADGGRGRMQMYIFTGPTPDIDGDLDGDVVIHEHTHGLSNRLIGNGSGLSNNRGGSMGEGWSDFYGLAMLSGPTDPVVANYTTGGYATLNFTAGFGQQNYYYGIRRFPYAVKSFVGPNGKPHNPLTFKDIETVTATDGAYACSPLIGCTGSPTEVHNAGEVWAIALWEVRAKFVTRLGWATGNTKVLQLVTDGMKLTPSSPNFIQARDAVISAAQASALAPEAAADVADVWDGFRTRGMGFGAADNTTTVVESFDAPNVVLSNAFSVSDSTGDNDGYPEPGESVLLSVSVTNNTGSTINNVVATVTGGGSANFGSVANGAVVTRQIPYTVPTSAVCGSLHEVTITVTSDVGTQSPQVRSFRLGAPVGGAPATFSNTTSITINDGSTTAPGTATPYPSNVTVSGLTGSKVIKLKLNQFSHTFPADVDMLLVGPSGQKMEVMSDQGGGTDVVNGDITLTDGAAAAIPATIVTGEYRPTADAGQDTFPTPAPVGPYELPATGGTATFASVFGTSGAAMNGTWSLYVVDDAGIDTGTITGGWSLTFEANDYLCSLTTATVKSRADFDGDGRTDLSVFRASEGNWYQQRSTSGFAAVKWGVSTDSIVPGDYDGDGKADTAVRRNADWLILNSSNGTFSSIAFGLANDTAVAGDFDGDGKTDAAVFRSSNNTWYIRKSSDGGLISSAFGQAGDVPVAADYDGDGKTDIAVYRSGQWIVAKSSGGTSFTTFGTSGDRLVPADYDGDNKDDVAVFRPSNGTWYALRSSNGSLLAVAFGQSGDVPVPGDYDGDGRDDQAVYRNGTWYLNRSTSGFSAQSFGTSTDKTVPSAYIP